MTAGAVSATVLLFLRIFHVRRQCPFPEIEDVRMQMTDHACVSRHSRGQCYGRQDHQSTRHSQSFCCVNGAQPQSRTQS